jgi:ParB-like chromosome segregation protein Spo0J
MEFRKGEAVWLDPHLLGPGPYTMSYGFDLDVLCTSIRKAGLIHPPWVVRNRQGSFEIVSGYRRILAFKALGESDVPCRDMSESLASPRERFLAAFYENLATRKFNEIEKAMVLHNAGTYVDQAEIMDSFMPLLSLPSHEGTLKFYLKLLDLEESVQTAIAVGRISVTAVRALVEMDEGDRQAVFHWISELNLNLNQQLKFIEYIKDISIREEIRAWDVLSDPPAMAVGENPRLNKPQKAKALLEILRARRSPRLAQAQHAVESAVSAISLPHGISIRYDSYLEDPYYQLEVRFRHGKELRSAVTKLHALQELEALPELWAGK